MSIHNHVYDLSPYLGHNSSWTVPEAETYLEING